MRPIKFRAWLLDKEIMLYDNQWYETRTGYADSGGDKLLVGDEGVFLKSMYANGAPYKLSAVPMQFTGLQDKNGKREVYEGDIIDSSGDVIGNQYENDHLLEEKTNLLIQGLGTGAWLTTYTQAVERGCHDAK